MKERKSAPVGDHQRPSLLIRGGRVVDPATRSDAMADVLIVNGEVAEVAAPRQIKGADETVDARGLIVAPGFVDLHVHLREPGQAHKETIASGTAAAAAGGFTAICAMPNTVPVNDSAEITAWMQHPERGAVVPVFPVAAASVGSLGETLTDFAALKRAGAVAVSDDGRPILEDDIMRAALQAASAAGLVVIQHAEDTNRTAGAVMHQGPTAFRLGLRGMTAESEWRIVERDVDLALQAGAHLHVAHLSTAGALKAVRRGKRARGRVTCEVTPHHFTLIDEDLANAGYDTHYKMNPPLRSAADREALLVALADGTVDAIATDHAPHASHDKQIEFDRAAFGITGLESALGLAISVLHQQRKLPLMRIVELLSTNPARIAGLRTRGSLARGMRGDVTLFDPRRRWTFRAAASRSKSRNTPFDGRPLTGMVVATIVEGRVVYRT